MRDPSVGYDIILMAETVYSVSTLPRLYKLIKKVARLVSDFVFLNVRFLACGSKLFLFVVLESSEWSCLHVSKQALLWRRRQIKAISICVGERWYTKFCFIYIY